MNMTKATSTIPQLLDLPVELLEHIIHLINSPKSVASLNQTCTKFRCLTEKTLYESVRVVNSRAESFAKAIAARLGRKELVRELTMVEEAFDMHELRQHWHIDGSERLAFKWPGHHGKFDEMLKCSGMSVPVEKRVWQNLRKCKFLKTVYSVSYRYLRVTHCMHSGLPRYMGRRKQALDTSI